jgi:hypothetical protein
MTIQRIHPMPAAEAVVKTDVWPANGPRQSPLDWPTLTAAFEIAGLIRCGTGRAARPASPTLALTRPGPGALRLVAEFNQRCAAQRMASLLHRLDVPVRTESATAGLRRRYDLHRLYLPGAAVSAYSGLLDLAWRQGRAAILAPGPAGATTLRHRWRPILAAAAWRSALLAAGRHVRRNALGVHVGEHDLAAVLVRSAQLLNASATLRGRSGCFLVSVPVGPDRESLLRNVELPGLVDLAA